MSRLTSKKLAQGVAILTFVFCYATILTLRGGQTLVLDSDPSVTNLVGSKNISQTSGLPQNVYNDQRRFQERALRSLPFTDSTSLNAKPISDVLSTRKSIVTPKPVKSFLNDVNYNTKDGDLTLNNIFISVKTTKNFHKKRLDPILKTWYNLAKDQTYFFTDAEDPVYQQKTNGHLINTNCSSSHNRKALCCKMSVEFDTFVESDKKWFCHFDDDNYVNIPRLVKAIGKYNPKESWYLGKPSIRAPLEILSRESSKPKISFWFATGGAGFCISRALAMEMIPIASGGKFISIGERIRLPDDVTIGYIVEHLLRRKLTVIEQFHSHLEPMKFLKSDTIHDQITFSYSKYGKEKNVVPIESQLGDEVDPTRFLSLHCHLFPNFDYCNQLRTATE